MASGLLLGSSLLVLLFIPGTVLGKTIEAESILRVFLGSRVDPGNRSVSQVVVQQHGAASSGPCFPGHPFQIVSTSFPLSSECYNDTVLDGVYGELYTTTGVEPDKSTGMGWGQPVVLAFYSRAVTTVASEADESTAHRQVNWVNVYLPMLTTAMDPWDVEFPYYCVSSPMDASSPTHPMNADRWSCGPALLEEYLWGHSEDVVDESEFSLYCGCDEMLSTSTACHRSALPAFGFPLGSSWIVVAVVVFLLRR